MKHYVKLLASINAHTLLAVIIVLLHNVPLAAQAAGTGTNTSLRTAHYEIIAEPGAAALLPGLAQELELRFELYNRVFRFNTDLLQTPLRIRLFTNRSSYDLYLSMRQAIAGTDALYLHYNNHIWRELVVLRDGNDSTMLASQSFFQFLKAFIPHPPLWMVEGFGIYFNQIRFDAEEGKLLYEENLSWLDSAKSLGANLISPQLILTANVLEQSAQNMRVSSWALVSFMMNSSEHYRTLTESFLFLTPHNTAEENSRVVMERFSSWIDFNTLQSELVEYIALRKTFTEHITEGRHYLETGNTLMADYNFRSANEQRPFHYAPYYYLGLLSYYDNNYDLAENYFLLSLDNGGDQALIMFTLGLNAAEADRRVEAIGWLERAAAIDPQRYRARTEGLIQILRR